MATDVGIIVPVLGRPAHAVTFLDSLQEHTRPGVATVYAICEADDGAAASWGAEGAKVFLVKPEMHTFAQKLAYAYEHTSEPWILAVGSDVVFHKGWWQAAMKTAQDTNASVIGTQDGHPLLGGGNERVRRGEHSVHNLFRRSYVERVGACWDGPGHITHLGYRHCFQDDEWFWCAQQHHAFAMSFKSFIEHRHVLWGKAENDAVYVEGESSMDVDRELFLARAKANGLVQA